MKQTTLKTLLAVRLPLTIDRRLEKLARRTGRTKTYYAREAILRFLEDMEDTYIAVQRLEKSGRRLTMQEAEAELGLDDRMG
jgi:RHH-type transcriptional regulator, rel operon repressor / antitoxin RelB